MVVVMLTIEEEEEEEMVVEEVVDKSGRKRLYSSMRKWCMWIID